VAAPASAGLSLAVTAGNARGNEIQVQDELLIGRHAPGAGSLAGDTEISRRHARIARTREGGYAIEDLGSTNGTFVNARRIAGAERLKLGDRIEVGATTLVVQLSADTPRPTAARAGAPPPVSLRVEIDIEKNEARLQLDEGSDTVRLVHVDGRWRIAPEG
jgi:pSer/pThr/pTyr-binding forkhead associated (FHA) protein